MFCSQCGKPMDDRATVCVHCGSVVYRADTTGKFGWGCVGALAPEAGIALYFVWKETLPLRARSVGLGAFVGVILRVFLMFLLLLILF